MSLFVNYGSGISEDTDRGRSPALWRGSHFEEGILGSNTSVKAFLDDFYVPATSGYTLTESDDNAAWAGIPTESTGVLRLTLATDDNEEGNIIWGAGENVIGPITENSGVATWFEARIRISTIADDALAIYCGLGEEGLTGANMQTDNTGVVSAKDYILARTVHVNGGTTGENADLDWAYNTASGTEVVAVSSADTLVANTWVKVGLYHDGASSVQYFINGVASSSTSDPSDATFPDTEELTFVAGAKMGSTAGGTFDIDWWAFSRVDLWANS